MNIVLLKGGFSPERDISLKSGVSIEKAITALNHNLSVIDTAEFLVIEDLIVTIRILNPDLVFIGLHGAEGEDGTIQAIIKMMNFKYTGSNHQGSAVAMDKYLSAYIAKVNNVRVPKQKVINELPKDLNEYIEFLQFPMIVKPNSSGSSVGVHIVHNEEDLVTAIRDSLTLDNYILLQQYIHGKELTVSILGNDVLPVVEIKPMTGFYTYENKYTAGKTMYICPAELSEKQTEEIKKYAVSIFQTAGCDVYGRVDFIFDGENFYFLEINTLPGMREESLLPIAAKNFGLSYNQLIERIIRLSMSRQI
ncbi:MAG: D-alanine--D-alanine ligase [Candidatus Cloacimonetes bacterium]|nr:D-alanine--D-alanine ligase [Candidatus Cloacimonadota bacterium]